MPFIGSPEKANLMKKFIERKNAAQEKTNTNAPHLIIHTNWYWDATKYMGTMDLMSAEERKDF